MATRKVNEGRGFIRLILVWSSLSPVFLLWAIRGVDAVDDAVWIPACLFLFALPTVILYFTFRLSRKNENVKTIDIVSSRDQSENLLTYLFAMLIPLFDVNLGGVRDIVSVAFALSLVVFLFWHMRLHYVNLIFTVWGYKIYTVEAKIGTKKQDREQSRLATFAVISRRPSLSEGVALTGYRLGGNVLMDKDDDL